MQLVIAGSSEDEFIRSVSKLSEGKSGFKEQNSQSWSSREECYGISHIKHLLRETNKWRKNQLIEGNDD